MTALKRFALLVTVFAIAIAGCSSDDDNPAGGGSTDTTPPSITSVTAIDAGHIDVVFNENVQRATAEDVDNYIIVETTTPLSSFKEIATTPGDTLVLDSAALNSDNRTVSLSTSPMNAAPYDMSVVGVKDASGNSINTPVLESFTGSIDPDITPPEVVYRSPAPNATNVAVTAQVVITFTEQVDLGSFVGGVTLSSTGGDVPYTAESGGDSHVTMIPDAPLELNTTYTVTVSGVQDGAGNALAADVSWTFKTTNVVDTTPPTLVSSSPANGAVNVAVDAALSLTFSEAIDQNVLNASAYPEIDAVSFVWSNEGKTLTVTPITPLIDNQQYTIVFLPGAFQDLAGNPNTTSTTIRFSTGAALATGSIAGTMSGDPASATAADPTGARVFAIVGPLANLADLMIAGSTTVAGNNTYTLGNLSDTDYKVLSVKDSNGDGFIDPELGDALGAYGVDFGIGDTDPDSVTIASGSHATGINFQLFDFSAISGSISYSGAHAAEGHFIGVGLFNVAGFDPLNDPDYVTEAFWPDGNQWTFWQLDFEFPDGSYYVGAFLDANDNFAYDAGSDPVGFYGGLPTPTAITVDSGSDTNDIVIPIVDAPPTTSSHASVAWRKSTKHAAPTWIHAATSAIKKDARVKQW